MADSNLLQLKPDQTYEVVRKEPASEPRDPCANCFDYILANDGSGSGLDADFLDGLDSTYYLDIIARLGFTPVNRAGDTMEGPLYLASDPVDDLEAATKKYVDDTVAAAAGIIYPLNVYNEGVLLGQAKGLDFVGSAVSASFSGGLVTVTCDGGATPSPSGGFRIPRVQWSGPGDTVEILDNGVSVANGYILNFLGEGVTDITESPAGKVNITIARSLRPDTINEFTAAQHIPWRQQNFTQPLIGGSSGTNAPDFDGGNNIYDELTESVIIPNPTTEYDGATVMMYLYGGNGDYTVKFDGSKWKVAWGLATTVLVPSSILISAIFSSVADKWFVSYTLY